MRKSAVLLMILCMAPIGRAVVIGDFETGLDGWGPAWEGSTVVAASQTPGTVTRGEWSMAVTTTGGYWCLQWDAPTVPETLAYTTLTFDLTMIQSEWPSTPWTQAAATIALNSDGTSGWKEYAPTAVWRDSGDPAPLDWGAWDPDAAKTYSVDISDYNITGATWLQIIVVLQGGDGTGAFYFDNIQLAAPDIPPVTPWHRYEAEDADLSGTYDVGSGQEGDAVVWENFSGPGYVRLQNPSGSVGMIAVKINAREAGDYPCRFRLIASGDAHWDSWSMNDDPSDGYPDPSSAAGWLCRENYACAYTWTMTRTEPPGNYTPEQWDTFKASLIPDGVGDGGSEQWHIIPMWGPQYDDAGQEKATPLTLPLDAGLNTLYIQAGWGWATYDYFEVELGLLPKNPSPADGGIAIIPETEELSWANAIHDLDYIEVWFGMTPEPNESDPNAGVNAENYKDLLDLIYTGTDPGALSSIPAPEMEDGVNYTWTVDGYTEYGDPNETFYGGSFWSFFATTNVPPAVDAGDDQYQWLNGAAEVVITLDGSNTSDDGEYESLTYQWTQLAGPEAVIDSPADAVTSATLPAELANNTEDGAADPYVFELEVYDGLWTRTDTVLVHVNSDSCRATIEAGGFYFFGDVASAEGAGIPDCKVDLYDLAELSVNWLNCSNIFESCD